MSQADQHEELACIEGIAKHGTLTPRSIGAFRLARASFDAPDSATAAQPSMAIKLDGCGAEDVHSASKIKLHQGLHCSASTEVGDRDMTMTDMDKEGNANSPRALETKGSIDLQNEQQAPAELGRVLVERAAQEQNVLCEPEPSQQPRAQPGDVAKACCAATHAQSPPELDMSPAWRRAMQCLSETGLSVFCPSKRQRMSAEH